MSKGAYEKMALEDKQVSISIGGEIRGIGKLSLPVIDRFKENVRLGSSQMEECEFLVYHEIRCHFRV